jgi:uncharacterized protein (DUF433 family)/DNA-binding transcriptional MerR regulator
MGDVHRMPPRGRYLAWEVGQLAGVSGKTIGQWARRRYIRSSVSEEAPRVYSFQDVAEAMVVHELLDRGVPHRDIRRAILALSETLGDWPLTEAQLSTIRGPQPDARSRSRIVFHHAGQRYDVGGVQAWQQVIEVEDLEEIRDQLRRGGWVIRTHPDIKHISVDPERLSGRPAVRGHRIAAQDVAELASTDGGLETLREDYGLKGPEIDDARRWWAAVAQYEAEAA